MPDVLGHKSCVVNDILTSYTDIGTGDILLFVHGWMDSKNTFNPLIELLSKRYRCIAVDLPNFGQTEMTETVISVSDYAKFVRNFMDKLGIRDFTYVGHSMGGQIGIQATGDLIARPKSLVLIASAGVRDSRNLLKLLSRYASKALKHVTPGFLKDRFYKIAKSDYDRSLSPIHKKIIASVLTTDVQKTAQKIDIPTLLLYGDQDEHTPIRMGQELHRSIAGSRLESISGANHWVHASSAKLVADQIEGFLHV